MGWNDIERGLGVVGAIPGKIMGSVVNPLLGGLNVRGAYAAGRGNHQAAAMIREQRNQQRGMQQQQQRMAQMRSSWDNAFPDGEFNPNLPQHRSAVFEILREGYPGENPYDHWERILGLQVKFNEAQASAHAESGEWKNVTVPTPEGDRIYQYNRHGDTREFTGPGADQGTPYKPPTYSEIGPSLNSWVGSDEHKRFSEVSERLAHIEVSYADAVRTQNPLAFITAVTSLAKILDPEGVVRDADFQVIAATQSLFDEFKTAFKGKVAGELDAKDTAFMKNVVAQARLLAKSSAEGNIGAYNRYKGLYARRVVAPQPEGHRYYELGDFPGVNPQGLIDRVNQATQTPTGPRTLTVDD